MELLRIATAGSVDDGKSTLIGRLLYDTKSLAEDILSATELTSKRQSSEFLNLALFTDGLRAEREQGITIDVAYRYFTTPKRKFILADTPGHVQYTRNMVTGASTADLALIIIDARNGVVEQSRRHAVIAALLGIRHIAVCVNKMDLVDFSEEIFTRIRQEFLEFTGRLNVRAVRFFPVSALQGDNVVEESTRTPWHDGGTLLRFIEDLEPYEDPVKRPMRLPVQYVIRPMKAEFHDYRGYAGTIADGSLMVGQEIRVLPAGAVTRVIGIETPSGSTEQAESSTAVAVQIADDLDISRGDMLTSVDDVPQTTQDLDATICWMSDKSQLREGAALRIKHTTRTARAMVSELVNRIDVTTLTAEPGIESLRLNEIGRVRIHTSSPIVCDDYTKNRVTGSFILIDEATNNTVAAGMIGTPGFGEFAASS